MAHTQVTFEDTVLMYPGNYHTETTNFSQNKTAYKGMFCTNTQKCNTTLKI